MKKPVLVIISEGHPYIDTGFIHPELNVINEYFSIIEVYPTKWDENPIDYAFPSNVIFSSELSLYINTCTSLRKKTYGLFSLLFWRNIHKVSIVNYRSLINSCGYVSLLEDWILKKRFDFDQTIFYTYWLTLPALSLSRIKEKGRIKFFISRAHGYDLYDERGDKILNLFKKYIFRNISSVFCISDHGRLYLTKRYESFADKFKLSRLGIVNERDPNTKKTTRQLEIVSCSFIVPVKRIELLIQGVEFFQKTRPGVRIHWTHIGGGNELEKIRSQCLMKLIPGTWMLKGHLALNDILDLYTENYYDCFLNVSKSEGLPVSIMEAQSAGIPVIATDVGGTHEIVNNTNGLLLSPDPLPEEISDALFTVYSNNVEWKERRFLSRKNWEENFRAESNYRAFGNALRSIFKEV